MTIASGGQADKLGNRYEGFWVARQLVRLVLGEIAAVQLEAVGDDEDGVDLWVTGLDGRRNPQQCKRKNRSNGRWTLADLRSRRVLQYLAAQLRAHPGAAFTFVSADPAPGLRDLAETARLAGDDAGAFFRDALGVAARAADLRAFAAGVGSDADDPARRAELFDLLTRTHTHVFGDDREGRAGVGALARPVIDGDGAAVVEALANLAQDNMGRVLRADEVRAHLCARGFPPRDLAGNPLVSARVEHLRSEFRDGLRHLLIQSESIERPEAAGVAELIGGGERLVVLHGRAGGGKSCVLLQLLDALDRAGVPHLPLRLDRRRPAGSARRFGIDGCDLPDSPAVCLHSLAAGGRAVLVLDQLDAVRWSPLHPGSGWEACREVMDEALALPGLAVVVACRTFDLRDDQQVMAWRRQRGDGGREAGAEVEVGDLPESAVARAVERAGVPPGALTPNQVRLLRTPLHLSLWVRVAAGSARPVFDTPTELMHAFWGVQFEDAARHGVPGAEFRAAVTALTTAMDRAGRLSVPSRVLEGFSQAAASLRSQHVVTESGREVAFAHQNYFEYQLATRLIDHATAGGRPVAEWLRGTDQSLMRRTQLRLVLTLLRDESPAGCVAVVRSILDDPAVRFHLKQLALRVLGEFPDPTAPERALGCELTSDVNWRGHAFAQIFLRHRVWFEALCDAGVLARWFESGDDADIGSGLWLCQVWATACGERVAGALALHLAAPDPWPAWVAGVLAFDPADDPERLFAHRLRSIREGFGRDYLVLERLAAARPERCAALIDAHLDRRWAAPDSTRGRNRSGRNNEIPYLFDHEEAGHLRAAARAAPEAFWPALAGRVAAACEATRQAPRRSGPDEFWRDSTWPVGRLLAPDPHLTALPEIVAHAGAALTGRDPAGFVAGALAHHPSATVQAMVGRALGLAPAAASEVAVNWLCGHPRRLTLRDHGGRRHGVASGIITAHSAACSDGAYRRLERLILGHYPARERRSAEWQRHCLQSGRSVGNDLGRSQLALLRLLPQGRLGARAAARLTSYERKFAGAPAEPDSVRFGMARVVQSPIRPEDAEEISDCGWLEIVRNAGRNGGLRGFEEVGGRLVERSRRAYARSLGERAAIEPGRFARLALRFPADAHPAYSAEVLNAAARAAPPQPDQEGWSPAPDAEVAALVRHVGYKTDTEVATALCRLARDRRAAAADPDTLALVRRYAAEHPHPATEWSVTNRGPEPEPDYELDAINCVRGAALDAVAGLLFDEPCLAGEFEPALRSATGHPSMAVRVAAVRACLPLLNGPRDLAVELFLLAADGADDRAMATQSAERFLSHAIVTHAGQLDGLLRRLAASAHPSAATAGAMWLAAGWVVGTMPPVGDLLAGNPAQRRGAALAAAAHCGRVQLAGRCAELLTALAADPDESVQEALAQCLVNGRALRTPAGQGAVEALLRGPAYRKVLPYASHALRHHGDSLLPLAGAMLAVCDGAGSGGAGVRDEFMLLAPALLRLYEQAEVAGDERTRAACLDRWDRLLETGNLWLERTLDRLETGAAE